MNITAEKLREIVIYTLEALGTPSHEAAIVTDFLIEANLVGHDSHGVIRLPQYVDRIKRGELKPRAKIKITKESSTTALIDGDWGFGQVIAKKAMEIAIDKAKKTNIAVVCVYNCNDVGRLGGYTLIAAKHNMIGIMAVNDAGANPHVAPWGGITPILSTNPISVAIPTDKENPILVDMATSTIAVGKLQLALQREEKVPEGWFIDASGKFSTNPADYFTSRGALLPLGGKAAGHKGFGLSLVVDILSGALSGAGCSSGREGRDAQGVFILVINVNGFIPFKDFIEKVDNLVKSIKNSRRIEGVKEILVPGEPEFRERSRRLEKGIFIEDKTWNKILKILNELNIKIQIDSCS